MGAGDWSLPDRLSALPAPLRYRLQWLLSTGLVALGLLFILAAGTYAAYTLAKPELQPILNKDLGKRYLYAAMEDHPLSYFLVSVLLGGGILFMAFAIHKKDQKKQMNWLYAGLGLGILNGIMILDSTVELAIGKIQGCMLHEIILERS